MKTILEYLQKGHITTNNDYDAIYNKDLGSNHYVILYKGLTLKEFINTVTPDVLTKTLKYCWQDAAKDYDMGRFNYVLDNGILAIEIMSSPQVVTRRQGKWWREAFVKNEKIKSNYPFVNSVYYMNEFKYAGEHGLCTFTSKWGDRLNKIAPDYIEYIKKNIDGFGI